MRIVKFTALVAALMSTGATGADPPLSSLLGPLCTSAPAESAIAGPRRIELMTGMGNAHSPADTKSPEAQHWFDYGLQLAHAFVHKDATEAFRRAERADPACALCVWGEAWSLGPTINYTIDSKEAKAAAAVAGKAEGVAGPDAPERTRSLIQALRIRYGKFDSKGGGDRAFASAMGALHCLYPDDVEIAVLDADASLIASGRGGARDLDRAVAVLEPVLKAHPDDAGAIHLFIHATEGAGRPELAEPYAERLGRIAPAASHLVHMPSHTYYRIGRYEDAATANLDALKADRAYAERTGYPTPLGAMPYHIHNAQFGIGGAVMSGNARLALELADRYARDIPAPASYEPFTQMTAADVYAAYGRYADTARVLSLPDPGASKPFLRAMRHYARGEAFARLGQAASVRAEAREIAVGEADLRSFGQSKPTGLAMVAVARGVLDGRAAMLENDPQAAAKAFRRAADLQDAKLSRSADPPLWWYPVRRSLAAALLKAGDAQGAVRETGATLAHWRADPMTLMVLAKAEEALRRPEATARLAQARRAWKGDPERLSPDQA